MKQRLILILYSRRIVVPASVRRQSCRMMVVVRQRDVAST